MATHKLTATFCLTAECEPGKGKTTYWDESITGLTLECRKSGTKTWAMRYVGADGRQHQHKIGRYEDITPEQARKAAKVLRSQIVLGGSPAAAKEKRKATPLYRELAEQHLAHAKGYLRRFSDVESIMRRYLLPKWGKRRIDDINPQELAEWFAELAGSRLAPASVEKIRAVLSRSFELAITWNMPGADRNPVRGLPRRKFNNARNVFLEAEQVQSLLEAAATSPNEQLKPAIQLFLLTGARKSELLNAKWEDVDLDRKAWHIRMSKNGHGRFVPLSAAAIDVIRSLPRYEGCPYLLPNPKTGKPFDTIKKSWETARQAAGLGHVRLHDLRHSAASFMINGGTDLYAVGKVLGHADYKSTMRYSHLANETLLAAVEAGAAKLSGGSHGAR